MKIIQIYGRPMFAFLLIASISMSACSSNKSTDEQIQTGTERAALLDVSSDADVAEISLVDEQGNSVSLKSLRGKVVFINFWATWCPPCVREMPSINTLKKSFEDKDNIVFLMVDVDGNLAKSKGFMNKHNYDLPVFAPASKIPPEFLGGAIPTTVILDKNGQMVARMEGGRDYSSPEIRNALVSLLNGNDL